ncbi:hypothetical protein V5O48_010761 [Marasmius crinis-equi]|uniref:Uncharacterized protein n=1 Tax=Marasmius crinis-equi TaxID=585013 RepID=A0ABR3F7H0_9AGAR
MPRAKLYFTRQQRQEAARKASAVYYQKNKTEIRGKRRAISDAKRKKKEAEQNTARKKDIRHSRRCNQARRGESKRAPNAKGRESEMVIAGKSSVGGEDDTSSPETLGVRWLKYATKLDQKVRESYGPKSSHRQFCRRVTETFISDYRNLMGDALDKVVDEHHKFENFVSRFQKYQDLILNSVGAGEVYDKVAEMRANAFLTVSALSDIYCEATSRRLAAQRAIEQGVLEKLGPIERALVRDYGSPWGSHIRRKGNARAPKQPTIVKVKVKPFRKQHKAWVSFQYSSTYMELADKGKFVEGITRVWKSFLERFPNMVIPSSGSSVIDAKNIYLQKEDVRSALYRGGMADYEYRGDAPGIPRQLRWISQPYTQRNYEQVDIDNIDTDGSECNVELPPQPFVKPRKLVFN